jgi:hypothetical protein
VPQGETVGQCFARTRETLLGKTGSAVLDATGIVGLATSLGSANLFSEPFPLSPDLMKSEGIFGRALVKSSFIERAALEAVIEHGSLPPSAVGVAQGASKVLGRVAPVVTAVAAGLEFGFLAACR